MNSQHAIAKKVKIPLKSRLLPYYDTVELVQNTSEYNFFTPTPSKVITRNNYVNNPFPGTDKRRIVGLGFEFTKQFIRDDSGNSINSQQIINAVKDAGVTFTADQNNQQMLSTTIEEHSNFSGTLFKVSRAAAHVDEADATSIRKVAVLKPAGFIKLPEPWDVAKSQSIDLKINLVDSSNLPTSQNWTDSTQGKLYLRAILYLAEIDA